MEVVIVSLQQRRMTRAAKFWRHSNLLLRAVVHVHQTGSVYAIDEAVLCIACSKNIRRTSLGRNHVIFLWQTDAPGDFQTDGRYGRPM